MRGSGPRAQSSFTVDLRAFGWERVLCACLRHSTLSFERIDAAPLGSIRDLGKRDRLSLVGQFAAHEALLQFAGVGDADFSADEWVVVQKRGADCRLVRIAGRRPSGDPIPILTIVQHFATSIDAPPVDVLRQSSGRADAVYCEIDTRLRSDATADLRWFRSAAIGEIAAPGIDALRSLLTASSGRFGCDDPSWLQTLRAAADDVLVIGASASPLQRYSGIASLRAIVPNLDALAETAIVERVIDAATRRRLLFAVAPTDRLDPPSRRVIDLLQASEAGVWVGVDGVPLPGTKFFVVSPRMSARQELDERLATIPHELRQSKLQQFIGSPCFARYLVDGVLPTPQMASPTAAIHEPERSYLAAVALLGTDTAVPVARSFLQQFSPTARIEDLVFDGVATIADGRFRFSSDDMRVAALEHIPASSRAPLTRSAAAMLESAGEALAAARLFLESDDHSEAVRLLDEVKWTNAEEAIRVLRGIRSEALSPRAALTLTQALLEAGRYRDARDVVPFVGTEQREVLLAQIERRTGHYASALARVARLQHPGVREEILRGELLALTGRSGDAERVWRDCRPGNDDECVLVGYHRAVLAIEAGGSPSRDWIQIASPLRPYYAARFSMYEAVAAHDTDKALALAEEAVGAARTTAERVDATLDHLFALFTAGRWEDARAAALGALLIADETQGDRAAGGILFMLAFLSADADQVGHAAHLLDRLRQFYLAVNDERRLVELGLIAAAVDLAHGRFESAAAAAESMLDSGVSDQIREAAALIAEEAASVTGGERVARARGNTANVELTDRFLLLRGRSAEIRRPFLRALALWEQNGGPVPLVGGGSDRSLLMRAALRRNDETTAASLARDIGIALDRAARAEEVELRALRSAATKDFPYGAHDFAPAQWRFATRNRLGQWSEIGSLTPLGAAELDRIFDAGATDWVACSDRELLYFQGLRRWSADSKEALAATFRSRSEQFRLRRILDQEEAAPSARAENADGIIGQAQAIHEISELVARIAKRDVAVCILGESGTGKELIARAIHRQSSRRHKPFTTVNCAALPENLIESELFGAARGAFTGAERDRAGLIESTDGGTLFLDEIGEMPGAAQAKLLRFLQEGEFRRVGETMLRSADVRVLTATNRKLEAAVEEGRFREDLYYRIRGVEISVPPLRDRSSDIPLLAAHFLGRERDKHRAGPVRFSAEAEAAFASYHWPGNVRELQNAVRAAHAIAGEMKEIRLEHLPPALQTVRIVRKNAGSYQDAVARFRRELIEKSLAQADGNQNQAAAMLRISRQALAYQIRELGILVTPSKRPRV